MGEIRNMGTKIPMFLLEMLENQYGREITQTIIEGYQKERVTTLRVNTLKSKREEIEEKLHATGIKTKRVSFYQDALIAENAANIRNLEIYHNGDIYLQSLSSMIPPILLEPKEKENILDMAAAPGGKTTQMAALSKNEAFITACEMNPIRAERLKYNIEKQDAKGICVMIKDARKLDDFFSFDKILLDAPCSGSGTIQINDKNLEKIFTEKLVKKSMEIQYALLKKAIHLLKPGKEMVYSTCSILACENEDILNKILGDMKNKVKIVPIDVEKMKEVPLLPTKILGTICVAPTELFEGFFVAKIQKIK